MKYVSVGRLGIWALALLAIHCSPARRLTRVLRTETNYTDHFTGVALFDPVRKRSLIQHNADKPFTPASNTKLFSFYGGLLTLPDSLPTLLYVVRTDSLIFWGTGNPLLLHPDLPDTSALAFLRSRPERLFVSPTNYTGPRFGSGWAWDDYNDDYSPELASLPIYGNGVRFKNGVPTPRLFVDSLRIDSTLRSGSAIRRSEFSNQFRRPMIAGKVQDVPFRWSAELAAKLLADTLHRSVTILNVPVSADARLLRGAPTDSLYKRMLHVSDNQFAEQVWFMRSAERKQPQLVPATERKQVADSVLHLPRNTRWVDGSGLSRYNVFSPNVFIDLLSRIYGLVPQKRLFTLLSATGESGKPPYVFAKSGSMTGVYCLSGYVQTRSDKLLYFSIMHNNFTQPVSEIRKLTADLLKTIHERF